jgi:hypothetical protein
MHLIVDLAANQARYQQIGNVTPVALWLKRTIDVGNFRTIAKQKLSKDEWAD